MTPGRIVAFIGHIDEEHDYNSIAVALSWLPPDMLDREEQQSLRSALDYRLTLPGIGFWVWEGEFEWYDHRGSIPDGETGCNVRGRWRRATPAEVAQAQRDALAREGHTETCDWLDAWDAEGAWAVELMSSCEDDWRVPRRDDGLCVELDRGDCVETGGLP